MGTCLRILYNLRLKGFALSVVLSYSFVYLHLYPKAMSSLSCHPFRHEHGPSVRASALLEPCTRISAAVGCFTSCCSPNIIATANVWHLSTTHSAPWNQLMRQLVAYRPLEPIKLTLTARYTNLPVPIIVLMVRAA